METSKTPPAQANGYSACVTFIFVCVGFVFLFPMNAWIPLDRRLAGLFGACLCGVVHFMFPAVGAKSIGQYIDVDVLLILLAIMAINFMVMRQPILLKGIRYVQDLIVQNPSRGIWAVSAVSFISSPFITNDGLCLLLTWPVLDAFDAQYSHKKIDDVESGNNDNNNAIGNSSENNNMSDRTSLLDVSQALERIDKFYFCLVICCSANIGSAMTFTGNPQNIIIAGHLSKYMSGGMFFGLLMLPAIVSCLFMTWYLDRCRIYERAHEVQNSENISSSFSGGPLLDCINKYIPIYKYFCGYSSVEETDDLDTHDRDTRIILPVGVEQQGHSSSSSSPLGDLDTNINNNLNGLGSVAKSSGKLNSKSLFSSGSNTSSSGRSPIVVSEPEVVNPIMERSDSNISINLGTPSMVGNTHTSSPANGGMCAFDIENNINVEMESKYNNDSPTNLAVVSAPTSPGAATSPGGDSGGGNGTRSPKSPTPNATVDAAAHAEKVWSVASFPLFVFSIFSVLIILELVGAVTLTNLFVYTAILLVVCTLLLNYYIPIVRSMDFDTSHASTRTLIAEYTEALFNDLDYNLIIIFIGLFIVSGSFVDTGVPNIVWTGIAGHTAFRNPVSITLISIYIISFSQLVGNVPLVYMAANEMDQLPVETQRFGWVLLAWVSTVAGNFTLCGSAANIIVAEKASRHKGRGGPVTIAAIPHFKVCGLVTLLCILVGTLIICLEFM